MHSIGFSMKVTIFVFSGFVFHVTCRDSHRQCVDVESETICYFMPNVSFVDWNTAWKTCRELDATLPVILSDKGKKVLEDYLSEHLPVKPVWTAGRYVGSKSEWRWLNGQNFSGTETPSCPNNYGHTCDYETQAVLTKQLRYGARYPNNPYAFICNFPGVNCTTEPQNSIPWKDGCLIWINYKLRLNKARNECLKGGGDLATFSDKEERDRLLRGSIWPKDAVDNEYWIGLHRKWWIWNTTDVHDIKYNLLDEYGDLGKDCLFINESLMWSRDKCSVNKSVICQTETGRRNAGDTPFTAFVTIGIVIAVLAVAITVVILLIVIRKRWSVAENIQDAGTSTRKSDPFTPSQKAIVEYQDDTYATIDLDDDLENLNYENGPKPCTSYTNVEFCDNPSAVYSEPTDFDVSVPNRSTAVYSDPYINSAVMTPAPKNLVSPSRDIYSEVNKPGKQKKSDELTSPPIKIGPQGDIYTLPISHN